MIDQDQAPAIAVAAPAHPGMPLRRVQERASTLKCARAGAAARSGASPTGCPCRRSRERLLLAHGRPAVSLPAKPPSARSCSAPHTTRYNPSERPRLPQGGRAKQVAILWPVA